MWHYFAAYGKLVSCTLSIAPSLASELHVLEFLHIFRVSNVEGIFTLISAEHFL